MITNAIGKKVINGVDFSIEVSGNVVKVSTNKNVSLEDIFNAVDEMLKGNYFGNLPKATAQFDDMGNLVIREKTHGRSFKVAKRYDLDEELVTATIPLAHILAYGRITDMTPILVDYR